MFRRAAIWKRAGVAACALGLTATVASRCMTRVGVAEVGVRVAFAGSARGAGGAPVVTGWVLYNPLLERVVILRTSVHTTVWTRDARPESPGDDSITFSSEEGVSIDADVALAFHIEAEKAPHMYRRFHQSDLEVFADGYLRNAARDALNLAAGPRSAIGILGAGQEAFLSDARSRLEAKLAEDGVVVDQLGLASAPRVPAAVALAIHQALAATLRAVEAENKVRLARAEAEQAVVRAAGQAAVARTRADGEAEARLALARADARANAWLRTAVSPSVLRYQAVQRWSGALPTLHGAVPTTTLNVRRWLRAAKSAEGSDDARGGR